MKKNWIVGSLLILGMSLLVGCGEVYSMEDTMKTTPVKVEKIINQTMSKELYYTGIIKVAQMQKLAFKNAGIAESISVKAGEEIKEGQLLISQDISDFSLGLRAAQASYQGAKAQYNKALNGASSEEVTRASLNVKKAEEGYFLAKQSYEQVAVLLEKGAVSKFEADQAKVQMEVQKATYEQAQTGLQQAKNGARKEDISAAGSQKDGAKVNVERYEKMIDEATLYAPFDGYVMDVFYEKNELIPAGYPAIIVRNKDIIGSIGVPEKEINQIEIGKILKVSSGQHEVEGHIIKIADIPDTTTMLYNVEISVNTDSFKVGSVVEVKVPVEERRGIWIPIQFLKIDTGEFVYVAEEGRAIKKYLTIEGAVGDYVLVTGIQEGDEIIIKGDGNINDQDPITIKR